MAVASLCPPGDSIHNLVPVGSTGFSGYSPQFTSDVKRDSYAGYIDLVAIWTRAWFSGSPGPLPAPQMPGHRSPGAAEGEATNSLSPERPPLCRQVVVSRARCARPPVP